MYVVKYECDNCGEVWGVLYKANMMVKKNILSLIVIDKESMKTLERVVCPVCGEDEYIWIKDRFPVEKVME